MLDNDKETDPDEEKKQRSQDLSEMQRSYESLYPKGGMGNYSKNQVRQMQGEEKKVRFTPLAKTNTKLIPLNMIVKKVDFIGMTAGDGMKVGECKVPKHCGGHNCPGDPATWGRLSAGGFKSPGGCSIVEESETRFF